VKTRVDALKHEAGFTIIEVLVAMFVLLIGVLATTTLLNTANATTERNQARNGATNLVRDMIEASRSLPYDGVNPTKDASGTADDTLMTALQTMAPTNSGNAAGSSFADADASTSGWQIVRRGITYDITVAACVIDDAKDGVTAATHSPAAANGSGYYCPNLPAAPTGDGNGDDYRRIKVTAAWTSSSCGACAGGAGSGNGPRTYSVAQTGVVVNPSGGLGPPPVGSPVWSNPTSCSSATVSQTFHPPADQAVFSVRDPSNTTFTANTFTTDANGDRTFSFTYNPSPAPPDNTYQVDINGLNAQNLPGGTATTFLYINCDQPSNTSTLTGGFNWRRCSQYPVACAAGDRVFDMDWSASPDADVQGYYVWRVNGTGPDWQTGETNDTQVACVSRAKSPPSDTVTLSAPADFLESFQPACYDQALPDPPSLPGILTGLPFFNGTTEDYWIQAVDYEETGNPTIQSTTLRSRSSTSHPLSNHSPTLHVVEDMLNQRPSTPALSITTVNSQPCLSWTNSIDLNIAGASLTGPRYYRIYRDANVVASVTIIVSNVTGSSLSVQAPDVPYKDRIGRAAPNASGSCDSGNPGQSWFLDNNAGGTDWNYWVTAVDQNYLESFPSNTVHWTHP
jgi:type IV pilus modification protein PilV